MHKATSIHDVQKISIHRHQKKEHPETILRSVQLKNLTINFDEAKEIYHIEHLGSKETISRGKHAHYKKRELFQVLIGSVLIRVKDGKEEKELCLNSPDEVLYIPQLIWHEIEFREKSILLVISSTMYHEEERVLDYIEDFESFKAAKTIS